jgi:hypothetical protein
MKYILSILLLASSVQAQSGGIPQAPDVPELPKSVIASGVESFDQFFSLDCVHPDGVLFRDHWLAAGYTVDLGNSVAFTLQGQNFYLSSALNECLDPTPPPGPTCDIGDTFRDGRGGDLWKPESDNTGKVVVLTKDGPSSRATCEVFGPDGVLVDRCSFRTIANGGREHWNSLHCEEIPDNSTFRLTEDGISTCWNVPDPCERQD